MAISGTNKGKTGEIGQHPSSPVQSPCSPTHNTFQSNQPEDWEKKVTGRQCLPFISSPDDTPKKSTKVPSANSDTNPFPFLPLHDMKT